MTIAVMDYSSGRVDIIENCPNLRTTDEVENYLVEVLEYNSDEIHFMFSNDIGVDDLTPDDFAIDEEQEARFKVIADIHDKFDAFKKENAHEPKYANCRVQFYKEENGMDVTIKMSRDFDEDEDDEHIFFYVNGVDQLVNLCYVDTEDFDLIEIYEFTDEI